MGSSGTWVVVTVRVRVGVRVSVGIRVRFGVRVRVRVRVRTGVRVRVRVVQPGHLRHAGLRVDGAAAAVRLPLDEAGDLDPLLCEVLPHLVHLVRGVRFGLGLGG